MCPGAVASPHLESPVIANTDGLFSVLFPSKLPAMINSILRSLLIQILQMNVSISITRNLRLRSLRAKKISNFRLHLWGTFSFKDLGGLYLAEGGPQVTSMSKLTHTSIIFRVKPTQANLRWPLASIKGWEHHVANSFFKRDMGQSLF